MSPGLDFQEAFLYMYSDVIMLVLGLVLAIGILLAIASAFVYVPMGPTSVQEQNDED